MSAAPAFGNGQADCVASTLDQFIPHDLIKDRSGYIILRNTSVFEAMFGNEDLVQQELALIDRTESLQHWAGKNLTEGNFKWAKRAHSNVSDRHFKSPEEWVKYAASTGRKVITEKDRESVVHLRAVGDNTPVTKATFPDGSSMYIRDSVYGPLFVEDVSHFMGIDICSKATVDEKGHVWTTDVGGTVLSQYEGKIETESLLDAMASSYLLGLGDAHRGNFKVDHLGHVRGYDFEPVLENLDTKASFQSLRDYARKDYFRYLFKLNWLLPPKYTKKFVEGLQRLTPQAVESKWSNILTTNEIRSLLLRREIILEDIRERGSTAVF